MTEALAAKPSIHETRFRPLKAIGLMSGTSMDGVDAAFVETDGVGAISRGPALTVPYAPAFRTRLKAFITGGGRPGSDEARTLEAELTDLHAAAVARLRAEPGAATIDLVGFHGQTIWHHPERRETWQMGDGARLARALKVPVAFDFRTADVKAGGQGAPLLPIFHAALAPKNAEPLAILNVGGVANITWIAGRAPAASQDDAAYETVFAALLGFDTGPGNGLIDDWVAAKLKLPMDDGGKVAARGRVHEDVLAVLLQTPFLAQRPPKSLDRFAFGIAPVEGLSPEDGAATLTAFTAACIARSLAHCPARPARLFVAGGGRHNACLMRMLEQRTGVAIGAVDELGWQGDALEAQAFAYLAVRTLRGLPITFPGTTGTVRPLTGGRVAEP